MATFGVVAAVANDWQGDTYVADFFNDAIRRIDAHSGVITTVAGEIPTSPIQQATAAKERGGRSAGVRFGNTFLL
jgi:hypothetical protein